MAWFGETWSAVLSDVGIVAGLFFSGLGFWRETRVSRAATAIELTKHHRELWMYYNANDDLHGLFDETRDMLARPLTSKETDFVSFLLNHIRVTFYGRKAGIYVQPECLELDVRTTFSYPAPKSAWERAKKYHDAKFVAFMDRIIVAR